MALERSLSTDWLGSKPVFYNTKTGAISHSMNEVVDYNDLEFDPEGFNNYLDFGYSVFEQTPVKHVKFLRHSSEVIRRDDGSVEVIYHDDPVIEDLSEAGSVANATERIKESVRLWEARQEGEIVIPTSGGFDSRMLNACIKDPTRIRSFTYGTSNDQGQSSEVAYARELSRILGTRWEQIPLGAYHQHMNEWDQLFGASTHAHGMYHIEFYRKILAKTGSGRPLLSGIIGDAWAGSVILEPITTISDLSTLGYSHGMHADSSFSLLQPDDTLKKRYFEENREKLTDSRWLVIEAMRFKMVLLSYLFRVPASLGFKPWSPFLDKDIALSMLTLPQHQRNGRLWQKDFFRKHGLLFEEEAISHNSRNTLMLEALQNERLDLLNPALFENLIDRQYIERINAILERSQDSLRRKLRIHMTLRPLYQIPYAERIAHRLKIDTYHLRNIESQTYSAYLTLKPIENLMKRRNGT